MNRGQRRARWQARFRQESGDKAAAAGGPASAPVAVPIGSTRGPALARPQIGSVQLRIDELVLRGFGRGSERSIAQGLEHELGRMLSVRGVADGWMHARSLEKASINKIQILAGENGHSIGKRLARALCQIPGKGNQ
jgi:hypothetical protein